VPWNMASKFTSLWHFRLLKNHNLVSDNIIHREGVLVVHLFPRAKIMQIKNHTLYPNFINK